MSIDHNDDFTEFTVVTTSTELNLTESFSTVALYFAGGRVFLPMNKRPLLQGIARAEDASGRGTLNGKAIRKATEGNMMPDDALGKCLHFVGN